MQTRTAHTGGAALRLSGESDEAKEVSVFVEHDVTNANQVVWVDLYPLAQATSLSDLMNTGLAGGICFAADGSVLVLDGYAWRTNVVRKVCLGEWSRVTFRLDYPKRLWDLYVDGVLAERGLQMGDSGWFRGLGIAGDGETILDDVRVTRIRDSRRRETARQTGSEFLLTSYDSGGNVAWTVRTNGPCALTTHLRHERPCPGILAPDGGWTDVSYGADGFVAAIEVEGLPRVDYAYDALGHVAAVTWPGPDGRRRKTSFVNNWRGKPTVVSYPDGTSAVLAYDGEGAMAVSRVDALGREDIYRWTLGLPVHVARVSGGVTNALYAISHDPQLNVVAIGDPLGRRAESYVLDENERVVAVTNLEGQVLSRRYALGRMVASETRFDGTSVNYGYGQDANLSSVAYPGDTLRFGYDGDGLLTSAANAAGLVSNVYDAATGWLDASCGVDGSWVRYVRSNGGAVTSRVAVAGTAQYAYDKAGRRVRADSSAGTLSFGYCPWNGLLAAVTNANGVTMTYGYDVMDRVTNITWTVPGGTALGGFAYEYDVVGRIVARRHALGTNRFDRAYAYDGLDRLVADGDVSYAYDAAGNRTAKRGGSGDDVAYVLGQGDRLATWTGGSYGHDAAGCVTRIVRGSDTWDLTWNGRYQLARVATNGVFAESYAYDALGRRVATTNAEGTERHVYDENWQVIADVDAEGNVLRSYEWGEGIDRLLAVRIGARTYAALTDVQGTVWGYADAHGAVVARWTYDAWGNVLSEEVAARAAGLRAVRYRFQGRECSAATGLVNFRMRWYDPVTGRWLSKDPIGLSGGLNLYAFCEGDPVNKTDPDGMSWKGVLDLIKEVVKNLLGYLSPPGASEASGGLEAVPGLIRITDAINATKCMDLDNFEEGSDSTSYLENLKKQEERVRRDLPQ